MTNAQNTTSDSGVFVCNKFGESKVQVFVAGVANGLRNSLLYYADKKLSGFKRYHIPSHNNPYFTFQNNIDRLKEFGGEESDEYQQSVLGRHGKAAFAVITRDQIPQKTFPLYYYRYSGNELQRGIHYAEHLDRPNLDKYNALCAGIDCGFVDPTIISVVGRLSTGIWQLVARYRLHRVDFSTQEKIIDWLHQFYKFEKIGIDIGSGGGGTQILHSLLYRDEYKKKGYENVIIPVQFGERVTVGYDSEGKELTVTTKTLGASLLIERLQQGELELSEIDHEGVSQLERITKQRGVNGDDKYFILSEKGNGPAPDDHLFASLICWSIATRDLSFQKRKKKRLARTGGGY